MTFSIHWHDDATRDGFDVLKYTTLHDSKKYKLKQKKNETVVFSKPHLILSILFNFPKLLEEKFWNVKYETISNFCNNTFLLILVYTMCHDDKNFLENCVVLFCFSLKVK